VTAVRRGTGVAAAAALWLGLAGPALADYEAGLKAYTEGDYAEALKNFRADAEAGHAPSQAALAILYVHGHGVEANLATAVRWFTMAAEQGLPNAQHLLGRIYFSDALGPRDVAKAIHWFEKASAQHFGYSDLALFSIYYKGDGVAQDLAKAAEHARRAAEAGIEAAQLQYGYMLFKGEGVERQIDEAYFWFFLAAQRGNMDGVSMATQIPLDALSSEKRLELERRALNWKPTEAAK
jgi:hypothetical protein